MVMLGMPGLSFAAASQQGGSQVSGTARTSTGTPVGNATVRLRNTGSGEIAQTARTNARGEYSFAKVPAGSYVVELVDGSGAVVATSVPVSLVGTESVTGVALTTAAGTAGVGAVAAGGAGHFFTTTKGILLLAAVGGGIVAGVVGSTGDKSPSK
jgi:hypothetical protein